MNDYSKADKIRFLEDFQIFIQELKPIIYEKYGTEKSEKIIKDLKKKFEDILPKIPFIGGDNNPMTITITSVSPYLAFCLVMKMKGFETIEIGQICLKHAEEHYKNIQNQILSMDNPKIKEYLKYKAKESEKRKYNEDYVYEFIEGEGFDYGLDFKECAICKYFNQYEAAEFIPYMCAMDIFESKYGDLGLHRTENLAEGASKCDFRYKSGRKTKISSKVLKD